MTDPFVEDRAWAQRMEFLSALLELSIEDQLAFMVCAVQVVVAKRTNHLQLLLWQVELAGCIQPVGEVLARQWRVVDAQPGAHVIG